MQDLGLRATDAISILIGDDKESTGRLANFTDDKINKTKRLSFITGKSNYYGSSAVKEYLKVLRNIEFLELKKENGEFICLVPVGEFKKKYQENNINDNNNISNNRFDFNEIEDFIESVENMNTRAKYKSVCVDTTVKQDSNLVDVLLQLRKSNKPSAVVIDGDGGFVGLITSNDIERRIADDVIYSRQAYQCN